MNEINRYISEAMRIRRAIQVYSEFFDSMDSLSTFNECSSEVTEIIRRSMHDEILISLARLFDGIEYRKLEYLSQRNLITKNEAAMNPYLINLRNRTTQLWKEIDIKNYRDLKVAHNDKSSLLDDRAYIKHNISYESAVELVETSIRLMLGLMASIDNKETVDVWANLNDKHIGKGIQFINALKTIKQ